MTTVLATVVLPNSVMSAGVKGRSIRRNDRVSVDNGAEYANVLWDQTLREYDIGFVPMPRTAWMDLEGIYEVTDAGAYGFLMEDPKDMRADTGEGVVVALGGGEYQLYKRYTYGAVTKDRKITRPRDALVTPAVSGVALDPADYTLDEATGIITIPAAPAAVNVTWTGRFYVPVHFVNDILDWEMVVSGQNVDSRFIAGPTVLLQEVRE